jgi:hypothetical protein
MKIATWINTHKILVAPTVLAMMWLQQNWSTEAFLYLALHGTYTLLWLAKYAIYRDQSFEERLPIGIGIAFVFLPLQAYLIAPWMLISRHVQHPPYLLAAVVSIYIIGVFLHFVSDAQKYFTLRERRGLITDGFFCSHAQPELPRRAPDLLFVRGSLGPLAPIRRTGGVADELLRAHAPQGPLAFALPGLR